MVGVMTVKENILFSANMRLPIHMPYEEKLKRVDHAIEMCGLTKVANTRIGTVFLRGACALFVVVVVVCQFLDCSGANRTRNRHRKLTDSKIKLQQASLVGSVDAHPWPWRW